VARTSRQLPPRVHIKDGAYYHVQRVNGKRPWTFLCRVSDGDQALYTALARLATPRPSNMGALIHEYSVRGMAELRPKTQKNYRSYISNLTAVFGHMQPDQITPGDVARYLETRKQAGAPVMGNREIEMLGSVYQYGLRNGFCESNPCRFVRRNKEAPRRLYLTHDEFLEAFNRAPEPLQDFLALAYLTGLRQKDLRELKRTQLQPEGIVVDESKTGKRRVVGWSDSLRWFVERACARSDSPYVLTGQYKRPWGEWGVQSAMRRLGVEWTLHQVRHKAETDHREGMGLLPLYRRITRHGATR
jgi:integrase